CEQDDRSGEDASHDPVDAHLLDLRRRLTSPTVGAPAPSVVGARVESGSTRGWMRFAPGGASFGAVPALDRRRLVDVLLSAAILPWWLVEAWTEDVGPRWLFAASGVAASIALLGRRAYPLAVALLFAAFMIGEAAAGVSIHTPVSPAAALFLVAWSVGAN